jgi:hypothetical protein
MGWRTIWQWICRNRTTALRWPSQPKRQRRFWKGITSVVYDLLFRTSAATLLEDAADAKHLGAQSGFMERKELFHGVYFRGREK